MMRGSSLAGSDQYFDQVARLIDREAFVACTRGGARALVLQAMNQVGLSTAPLRVTRMLLLMAEHFRVRFDRPVKRGPAVVLAQPLRPKPVKPGYTPLERRLLRVREVLQMAAESQIRARPSPLTVEVLRERFRLALLLGEDSSVTDDAPDELIEWLHEHDYIVIVNRQVQILGIPVLLPPRSE